MLNVINILMKKYNTIYNNRRAITGACIICGSKKYMFLSNKLKGSNVDIHKLIDKLPRPQKGFGPLGYNYVGPYNPLDTQVSLK